MPRHLIALLISLYAISFAFGAMAAIRWPSIMMVAGLMLENDPLSQAAVVDWRQLGIAYGAPYFLAALCLYASALSLSKRRQGAVGWYFMGVISGFPCVFLVDFEQGWWRDPSAGEGAVAGAALASILLGIAVWALRRRPVQARPTQSAMEQGQPETVIPFPVVAPAEKTAKPKPRQPVPAAIARQRAQFARDGQRMLAKRRRA